MLKVTDIDTHNAIINVILLNLSYKFILRQANRPTKNVNTFHVRVNNDMDKTVIVNDVYELIKSANCNPS